MVDSLSDSFLNPRKKIKLDDSINSTTSSSSTVDKKPDFLKLDGKFSCLKCRFNHKSAFYFDYHMETVHQTSLPICFKCNCVFKNLFDQNEHCSQVHRNANNSMFECFICAQSFEDLNKFDGHTKLCHGPECAKLGDFFYGIETETVEAKTFKCSICRVNFITKQHRDNHLESKHTMLFCFDCDFSTRSSSDLNLHFQNVHFHRCRRCDTLFVNAQRLEDHIKATKHSQNKLKSNVEKVITISQEKNIDLHKIDDYITPVEEAHSHVINIHKKEFPTKSDNQLKVDCADEKDISLCVTSLYKAKPTEANSKSIFQCSDCSSRFGSRMDLNAHIDLNHPLFKCPICTLSFRSDEKVQSHVKNIHQQGTQTQIENAVVHCQRFDKEKGDENVSRDQNNDSKTQQKLDGVPYKKMNNFSNAFLYQPKPMELRESLNTFQCSTCSSGFASRVDLFIHIKLKHPLINCPLCPLSFRSVEKVKSHMKNIHAQQLQGRNESFDEEKSGENDAQKKSFIPVQYLQIDKQDNFESLALNKLEEGLEEDVKDIEIDEKFSVDELPVNATDKNLSRSINDDSTEMKQEVESLTSHVKIEDFFIKDEQLYDDEKESNVIQEISSCPVCKMIIPSDLLLSTHIESEHLSTPDPNEDHAIAEFL